MAKSKLTDIGKANAKIDELVAEKQTRILRKKLNLKKKKM
jgi:hypothetical protein